MTTNIALPVAVAVLLLTVGIELFDIATAASDKAIAFSEEMNSAIDCAVQGIALEECSPGLTSTESLRAEAEMTRAELIRVQNELESLQNATQTNSSLVVVV